jgi:glycosyltransferase involved in cell wall biosynthesis
VAEQLTGHSAAAVVVDAAGGPTGGAARFRAELHSYLRRSGREDVHVIGAQRRLGSAWLLRRELIRPASRRRVSLNNVGFLAPGGERWTLLRNALHFLDDEEESRLDPSIRGANSRRAATVRMAARRSDVLVAPSTAMADRVTKVLPNVRGRIVVRPHPVSADSVATMPREPAILCPVLFAPYKHMAERLTELLAAIDGDVDPSVRVLVTAEGAEVPASLTGNPRIRLVGRLAHADLRTLSARCRVIYFPTGLESFGYPLAEARAGGQPVIALDTPQNREIAGPALCGFVRGDRTSLKQAAMQALTRDVIPDPGPFDPDAYFHWLLGTPR